MEYIRNRIFSSNKDDIELCDLESSNSQMRPANTSTYPTPLEPGLSNSQIGVGDGPPTQPAVPNYSHSFPTSDAASNIHTMDSMQTSGGNLQLLSPAEVEMQSNANQKRSGDQNQADSNRVRIVAQTSRMPTVVSVCYL
jgi:hypothetical protein